MRPERPPGRGRHVLRRGHPRDAQRRRDDHDASGAGRPLWGKQYYECDVHRWLHQHRVAPVASRRARRAGSATARGSTCSPATSSRCPTIGNTRGSSPGTWRSTARPCRWWTSTSPRSRSSCCSPPDTRTVLVPEPRRGAPPGVRDRRPRARRARPGARADERSAAPARLAVRRHRAMRVSGERPPDTGAD